MIQEEGDDITITSHERTMTSHDRKFPSNREVREVWDVERGVWGEGCGERDAGRGM